MDTLHIEVLYATTQSPIVTYKRRLITILYYLENKSKGVKVFDGSFFAHSGMCQLCVLEKI